MSQTSVFVVLIFFVQPSISKFYCHCIFFSELVCIVTLYMVCKKCVTQTASLQQIQETLELAIACLVHLQVTLLKRHDSML